MELREVKQALAACPTFAGFERDEIDDVAEAGAIRMVTSGRNLINEGDTGSSAYLVLAGAGEVYKRGSEGEKQHHLAKVEAGQLLGEVGLLLEHSRSATITASRDLTVFELSQDAFNRLLDGGRPAGRKLLTAVARGVARRSREVNERLVALLEDPDSLSQKAQIDLTGLKDRFRQGFSYI